MDKFGIFELLDTLSQIASEAQSDEKKQPAAPETRVSADDKSFLPPDFQGKDPPQEEQKSSRNALSALYERHESISKRIDKNK